MPSSSSSWSTTTIDDSSTASEESSVVVDSRTTEAVKQLFCGGIAGSVAKTITAPFSRLTILYQVHSMVTTKEHRPRFAMSLKNGVSKIIERGGILSLWRGNMTSVLHRFPYSAINFAVYENALDFLSQTESGQQHQKDKQTRREERNETSSQLARRVSSRNHYVAPDETTKPLHKFMAGAMAGTTACLACYPLDLIRTRLTTEFEGHEHYRGIFDAFRKVYRADGLRGFYSGVVPTLLVAVPNFAISYTAYGTLKEHALDDDLFYNLRKIDAESGEPKLGFLLTLGCGSLSGIFSTMMTFPMDTIRRRMQIQSLHVPVSERLSSIQLFRDLVMKEGAGALYRGLTPELLKVIPMVGSMFLVYEWTKEQLNVSTRI